VKVYQKVWVKSLFPRFFDIQFLKVGIKVLHNPELSPRVMSSFFDTISMVTLRLLLLEVRKIFDLRTEIINW